MVLVLVHEFGHFFTAKSFGIRVDEFGFGFPPKLFSFKKGETEYSINALPFGGFVKIFGENVDDADLAEVNALDKKDTLEKKEISRSLISKPRYQQALVMFAGIFANFVLAWILFSFGFITGLPTSVSSESKGYALEDINLVVVSVQEGSPAEISGLISGDKIISVNSGEDVLSDINTESFKSFILNHPNQEIDIGYLRGKDKNINTTSVIPKTENAGEKPMIGISMDQIGKAKLPFLKAFGEGLRLDWTVTKGTVVGLYTLIADGVRGKGDMSSVSGPVGMVGIVGDAYKFGFAYLLSFAALISVNLAVVNFIPFPALDGGRLLFLLIEKIKGSPMNPKIANTMNAIGFAILIILMLLVTFSDITKLF